jgi:hypothetical protein
LLQKDHWHQFSFCVVFVSLLFSFPQDEDRFEASVSVLCTKEEKELWPCLDPKFGIQTWNSECPVTL